MLKVAAIKLQPLLKELDARILMFIHDEIVFDVPEEVGAESLEKITEIMCNALPLNGIKLTSDIEAGKKWGQKMSTDEIDAFFKNMHEK